MHDVSGVTGAAPVWQAIMNRLNQQRISHAPKAPVSVIMQQVAFSPAVEPPRREAFIDGTQMQTVSLPAGTLALPHIAGPGNGAVLAFDPDIPASKQYVRFSVRPLLNEAGQNDLIWQVDGEPRQHDGDGSLRWIPIPGAHTIQLLDNQHRVLDETRLTVRGKAANQ
jgi:penicillin-binding protein 1C